MTRAITNFLAGRSPLAHSGEQNQDENIADMTTYNYALQAKARFEETLVELTACRDEHLEDFNKVRKCLEILLDRQMSSLAISGESKLRHAVNHFAHLKNKDNADLRDALTRVRETLEQFAAEREDVILTDQDIAAMENGMEKLTDVLYDSDKYLEDERSTVEMALDAYLWEAAFTPTRTELSPLINSFDLLTWTRTQGSSKD